MNYFYTFIVGLFTGACLGVLAVVGAAAWAGREERR